MQRVKIQRRTNAFDPGALEHNHHRNGSVLRNRESRILTPATGLGLTSIASTLFRRLSLKRPELPLYFFFGLDVLFILEIKRPVQMVSFSRFVNCD